jgi:hypothetical protein
MPTPPRKTRASQSNLPHLRAHFARSAHFLESRSNRHKPMIDVSYAKPRKCAQISSTPRKRPFRPAPSHLRIFAPARA